MRLEAFGETYCYAIFWTKVQRGRRKDSCWSVDLGSKYGLFLSHYELRNSKPASTDSLLTEWQLKVSMDGGINTWENTETIFDKNDPGSIIATVMLQAGGRLKVKGKYSVAFALKGRELINRESTEFTYQVLNCIGLSSTFELIKFCFEISNMMEWR